MYAPHNNISYIPKKLAKECNQKRQIVNFSRTSWESQSRRWNLNRNKNMDILFYYEKSLLLYYSFNRKLLHNLPWLLFCVIFDNVSNYWLAPSPGSLDRSTYSIPVYIFFILGSHVINWPPLHFFKPVPASENNERYGSHWNDVCKTWLIHRSQCFKVVTSNELSSLHPNISNVEVCSWAGWVWLYCVLWVGWFNWRSFIIILDDSLHMNLWWKGSM